MRRTRSVAASERQVVIRHREVEVQRSILDYLKLHRSVAWAARFNSGVARFDNRFVRLGFPGCPDILGQLVDGRLLAIEVKAAGGRASKSQTAFLEKSRRNHGVAFIARSVDDVTTELRNCWSPPKP